MVMVKEMVERFKVLSELYLREDKRIFIRDIKDDYFFADILLVGESRVYIQCFAPESKAGQKFEIPWASIIKLEEYIEKDG